MVKADTLIVGGGIAGLAAAAYLSDVGHTSLILEARDRIGGRVLSFDVEGEAFELGPSWVWPGQPLVAAELTRAGIQPFEQYATGALLYQQADGRLDKHDGLAPMANALRIKGGPSALVHALAARVPSDHIHLSHQVTSLTHTESGIRVEATTPEEPKQFLAQTVALALPPRLCSALAFQPALGRPLMEALERTPTWMAGHAKFTAVYDAAFWREAGLSGEAMSRRGPLVEIHDISPHKTGPYALFGFMGVDAAARRKFAPETLHTASLQQLGDIFGPQALAPIEARLQDWNTEPFTAGPGDEVPLAHHPAYGLTARADVPWVDQFHVISSETAHENGGLIEGALQRGKDFAEYVLATSTADTQHASHLHRAPTSRN